MDRRNFLKLVGCAILAPMGTGKILKKPVSQIALLNELTRKLWLNELVRFKMNECQAMLRKQMVKALYSPVLLKCEVIQDGIPLYCSAIPKCSVIDGRNFFKGKPPPNKKID